MMPTQRMIATGLVACLLVASGARGAGGPPVDKQTCAAAYEKAQEDRQGAQLRAAREELRVCANASCPLVVRTDCGRWQAEVERDMPTFVLRVRAASGLPAGLRVVLDGSRTVQLEQPTEADPGGHSLHVEAPGFDPFDQSVLLKPGERAVPVVVSLQERPVPSATPPPPPESPSYARVVVASAVGVLALGGFAYLGITGKSRESGFGSCKPYCPSADVDEVRTRYIVADVALGVGVIAAGLATYWWAATPSAPQTALRWSPIVGPSTAGLGVSGGF
jgi:hypothetical protein